MQTIEFEIVFRNGAVSIPARYSDWEGRKVKVIFLLENDEPRQQALRASWRERMTLTPVLKTAPETLLEPASDGWEPYL